MIKRFLLSSKDVNKDAVIWNALGSGFSAFQSVILLMVLTRTVGLIESGIFTIAYANANLFLNVGKYGMRNFQSSDITNEYSFHTYKKSRVITCLAMIFTSLFFSFYLRQKSLYTTEKFIILILMAIFKVPDAYEDIYYGEYQREGRLDIATKSMTFRVIATTFVFVVLLIVTKNQLLSLFITTIATYLIMGFLIKITKVTIKDENGSDNCLMLLKNCFPVFASSFLSFYLGNIPKYAIDSIMSDEIQAIFGFIFMPVFVIGLIITFALNPMILDLSILWGKRDYKKYNKSIVRLLGLVFVITLVSIFSAYFLGTQILSLLYNTNLLNYRLELILLLIGGGFLGASGVLSASLTIQRKQNSMCIAYSLIAILSTILSKYIVIELGILGAIFLYLSTMCILSVLLFILGGNNGK